VIRDTKPPLAEALESLIADRARLRLSMWGATTARSTRSRPRNIISMSKPPHSSPANTDTIGVVLTVVSDVA